MKKNYIMFLSIFAMLSISLNAQNMLVNGAGTAGVDGIYVVAGINNDVSYYQKGSLFLYYRQNLWRLATVLNTNILNDTYYYVASTALTPDGITFDNPYGNWLGSAPYPTVSSTTLPVELTAFTAAISNYSVQLQWQTATEVNNYGFEIQRTSDIKDWSKVAFVEGHGNSNSPKYYSFTDNSLEKSDKYFYRLKQVDIDGTFEYSAEVEVNLGSPNNFKLSQNYPNPFNPTTSISYSLPNDGHVTLNIYDALGKEVAVLDNGFRTAGNYSYSFDASNLTSGIYFYKIRIGSFVETKKMLLMK